MLSNVTNVTADWRVKSVPNSCLNKEGTTIIVDGYEQETVEDDPSVFFVSPSSGIIEGPSVSVTAAMSANPNDLLRR